LDRFYIFENNNMPTSKITYMINKNNFAKIPIFSLLCYSE